MKLLFLLLVCSTKVLAQHPAQEMTAFDQIGYSPSVPPSPEAASLGKYGQYEVNLAYGVPNIGIPLFEINSGTLTLASSLSYHAGGNKANDEGSWVGLGWSLQLGGVITRTVRGLPDEFTTGGFQQDAAWYGEAMTNGHLPKLENAQTEGIDTEPDLYSYSFGSYSGGFVFNNGGTITPIPFQPLKITMSAADCPPVEGLATSCRSFTIVDAQGVSYYFQEMEVTQAQTGRSFQWKTYVSSWYLSRIEHPNGYDKFTFTYNNVGVKNYAFGKSEYKEYGSERGLGEYTQKSSGAPTISRMSVLNEKRISRVTFANGQVDITGSSIQVKDMRQGPVVAHSVTLNIHEMSTRGADCQNMNDCQRKKLSSLVIDGRKYAFAYNESYPQFSYETNKVDHWGYFNASSNTTRMPKIRYNYVDYGGNANRYVNTSAAQFGILTRITYPTGGYTDFTYGSNRISRAEGGKERFEIEAPYKYTLDWNGNASSIPNYTPRTHTMDEVEWVWPPPNESVRFNVDDFIPASQVTWYSDAMATVEFWTPAQGYDSEGQPIPVPLIHSPRAMFGRTTQPTMAVNVPYGTYDYKFASGSGSPFEVRVKTVNLSMASTSTYVGNSSLRDYKAALSFKRQTQSGPAASVRLQILRRGYVLRDYTGSTDILAGGLRIESIANYDARGELLTRKTYSYGTPEFPAISSGMLLTCALADITQLSAYYSTYDIENELPECGEIDDPKRLLVHDNPEGRFGGGYAVGYKHVTETITGKDGNLGRTEYTFIMKGDILSGGYPMTPSISHSHLRGVPAYVKYYTAGKADPVKIEDNRYATGGTARVIQAAVVTKNRTFPQELQGSVTCQTPTTYKVYAIAPYQLYENSEYRLTERIVTEYSPAGDKPLQTRELYEYDTDPDYQMLVKKTTYTDDQVVSRGYVYQYQLGPETGVPGNVREEVARVDGRVVGARRVDYEKSSPTAVYQWKGQTPDDAFTAFNGTSSDDGYAIAPDVVVSYYSPTKRVKTVLEKDGIQTSYIWDGAGEMVGMVRNCGDVNLVGYLSFDGPKHRMADVSAVAAPGTGLVGGRGYSLTNGAVTSLAMAPGKYRIEFWYDSQAGGAPVVAWKNGTVVTAVPLISSGEGRWRQLSGVIDAAVLGTGNTFTAEISGTGMIDEVRLYPATSQMTTFVNKRFVGITAKIDVSGVVQQYNYDVNGRLIQQKDVDGSILQQFEYNLLNK